MNKKHQLLITKLVFKFAFITDFINGWISGFPLCCILNFCKHSICGRTVSKYCESLYGTDKRCGYVRCKKCRDNDYSVKVKDGGIRAPYIYLLDRWNLVLTCPKDKSKMHSIIITEEDFFDRNY